VVVQKGMLGRTSNHAPSNDEATFTVRTASCKGGTGEGSANFCTDDSFQKGHVAEGEKAPFGCCWDLKS
jgi:hypothetical protein